jgi:predicted nucleic acid-binding protein
MKSNPLFFFDTNIFIYLFEGNAEHGLQVKKMFELLALNKAKAITSIITQVELLSLDSTPEDIQQLLELFLETPNLRVLDLGSEIATEAARIRRQYHFRTPDAIQLATAVLHQVDLFITNDRRLDSFGEVNVELI